MEPSSLVSIAGCNSVPHCAQVNPFIAMPQPTVQEYVVMFSPLFLNLSNNITKNIVEFMCSYCHKLYDKGYIGVNNGKLETKIFLKNFDLNYKISTSVLHLFPVSQNQICATW